MTDTQKRKGAPKKCFSYDEIEALRDEYIQIPDGLMMAVDKGFGEVLKVLSEGGGYQLDSLSSLDCLKAPMHKKLQEFARVVRHRKAWYARLEVIKRKDPKKLSILERQALRLDGIEGREAYIQLQKALKACVDADEDKAKEADLASRLENRAKSIEKRAERGTSPTAERRERRARTAWLCFIGSTFEKAVKIVGYEPISFLEGLAKQANNHELFSLLDEVKKDKRNQPS